MAALHNRQYAEIFLWLGIWFFDSPTVVFLLKGVLRDFPYPVLLTGLTNIVTCVILNAFLLVHDMATSPKKTESRPEVQSDEGRERRQDHSSSAEVDEVSWLNASILGGLQGIEISMGNFVLNRVSVALRTELHMTSPLLMFTVACLAGVEQPTQILMLSVALITVGGVLSTSGSLTSSNFWVVFVVLLQGLIAVVRWVMTQKLLWPVGTRAPSPLRLAARLTPCTTVVALLGACVYEPSGFSVLTHRPFTEEVLGRVLFSGVGVAILIVAELRTVQLTSALLLGIFVPLHNVFVILISTFVGHHVVTKLNWFGIFVLCTGTGVYTYGRRIEGGDELRDKTVESSKDRQDYNSCSSANRSGT